MAKGHAEIAGGGMGGLTAAAALAQRGWTVRVHERAPDLSDLGYGLATFENGLRVLRAVGAEQRAIEGAAIIRVRESRDKNNQTMHRLEFPDAAGNRMIDHSRAQILTALGEAAERAGAEIVYGSEAVAAEPEGVLVLADGTRRKADLVIAADGIRSKVRDSLGLPVRRKRLHDGCVRTLVRNSPQGREAWEQGRHYEYWSNNRRIIFVPTGRDTLFLALNALNSDAEAIQVPVNADVWRRSFPHLGDIFERLEPQQRWDSFNTIRMDRWSLGRVVVLGDAAHAMAPNLGQGAACATMSALSLACHVAEADAIEQALLAWEGSERPIIAHTQFYSELYSRIMQFPAGLQKFAFHMMSRSKWLAKQRLRTANYVPKGAEPGN